MSFDNFYSNRKDHRKQYYGSKRFDRSCRNHKSCGWCRNNRLFRNKKREPIMTIKECLEELCAALEMHYDNSSYPYGWPYEAVKFAERFIEQSYLNEKAEELS